MPERQFVDREGRSWEVWEVCPDAVERRLTSDPARAPEGEERRHAERRAHLRIPDRLRSGWLAFETAGQRRRLAPFPERWRSLTDLELEALLAQSRLVPRLAVPSESSRGPQPD